MEKYILTEETVNHDGKILYRIQAIKDFGNVKKGDLGGFIEKEDNLSQLDNAWVYGDACVYGDAWVYGNARVNGNVRVCDNARVYGNARVCDNARVYGDAWVYGNARVNGNVRVYGDTCVYGNARVCGDARVYGNARVCGNAWVYSIFDLLIITGLGSQSRTTTIFKSQKGIEVNCGCFNGTLDEFREKIKETHKESRYAKEYLMLADLAELRLENRCNEK